MTADLILYQTIYDADGEAHDSHRWEAGPGLRSAIEELSETRTAHCGGVEYQGAHYQRWNDTLLLHVQNAPEYRTGYHEERTLAICGITHASARRLARLLSCEWGA